MGSLTFSRASACLALTSVLGGGPSRLRELHLPLRETAPHLGAIAVGNAPPPIPWTIPPRFGLDANRNAVIDIPNTPAYVQNCETQGCDGGLPKFLVHFNGGAAPTSQSATHPAVVRYEWTVTGSTLREPIRGRTATDRWSVALPEGEYDLERVFLPPGGPGNNLSTTLPHPKVRQHVTVEDLLIVALGDSYASGEGNPEKVVVTGNGANRRQQVFWADDGASPDGNFTAFDQDVTRGPGGYVVATVPHATTTAPTREGQDHVRSHRSSLAASAQLALAFERADPHTSVTYVAVGASGAELKHLSEAYAGVSNEPLAASLTAMEGQLRQVQRLVGQRKIDALVLSIGGNDVGFAQVIAALLINDVSSTSDLSLRDIGTAVHNGRWDLLERQELSDFLNFLLGPPMRWKRVIGLDALPAEFERFAATLDALREQGGLSIGQIYLTEYPDPTGVIIHEDRLARCQRALAGIKEGFELGPVELEWAVSHVVVPLNGVLRQAAGLHGWTYVPGISNRFVEGHGICAAEPYDAAAYPHPRTRPVDDRFDNARTRWLRQAAESRDIQGPFYNIQESKGIMHPNELGHRAAAQELLKALNLPMLDSPGMRDSVAAQLGTAPRRPSLQSADTCFTGCPSNRTCCRPGRTRCQQCNTADGACP